MDETNDLLMSVIEAPLFNSEQCEQIIEFAKNFKAEIGTMGLQGRQEEKARNSKIIWLRENQGAQPIFEKINEYVLTLNESIWKFDLSRIENSIQFTIYDSNKSHYDWHIDVSNQQASRRKLSMVVQLTDPLDYEGGDLRIQSTNLVTAGKKRGNSIVFPSTLAHKVNSPTKGIRCSLVAWVCGTPIR